MTSLAYPKRVVCLTEETVETLYAIGADHVIVGVSGFAVRPKRVRKEKPRVSTYLDAKFDDILALRPDVVFTWSDLQADISAELLRILAPLSQGEAITEDMGLEVGIQDVEILLGVIANHVGDQSKRLTPLTK